MRGGKTTARRRSFKPAVEFLEHRLMPTVLPAGFSEALVANNIGSTTAMAVAPDGRIFVTTQSGDVRVIKNGSLLGTAFFHFNDVDSSGERGVLGVAFDPSFTSNHFVYLYHTVAGSPAHNEVSRFTANGDVAASGSKVDILQLNDLSGATNHNGGAMHFGKDGKLYIAVGENANPANSQTLSNLLGKVLRIDVSTFQAADPVNTMKLIPSDNPFTPGHATVASGINQAIYGLGFRNPFTFGVDSVSGTIFINDVGQNTWEEIDRLVAGGNYGWGITEGFFNGNPSGLGPGTYQNPLMSYNHNNATPTTITGVAIVGGAFYEPPAGATNPFPSSYTGKYFFSDLTSSGLNHDHSQNLGSWIRIFNPANPGSVSNPDTSQDFASQSAGNNVDITLAPDGGLYYLSRNGNGQVLKISFTAAVQPPTITQQPTNKTVSQGGSATFTVTASGSGTLSYQWQRNNGSGGSFVNISGATASSFTISNVQLSDNNAQFRVIVSNAGGSVTSNAATLTVTSNRPPTGTITITGGLRNGNFDAGTPIAFTLSATDPEDGTEPASRFTYQVDYVTSLNSTPGGVVRPFVPATSGVASASFTPATTGPYTLTDVLYRITFTVKDSGGLTTTVTRDITPNTVTLTEQTNPTGLQVIVDGQSKTAPTSFASVVGFVRGLNAPTSQTLGSTSYTFVSWSDGGAAQHNVTTPASNQTFTATYAVAALAAPSNLTASAVSSSQINVSWKDNSNNETGFQLQRATDSGFTHNVVTTNVAANTVSAQVTGLASNTTYFFRVRAVNGSANSAYSNTASATTKASGGSGPFQQDSGADGLVVMEAEDFAANVSQGGKSWVLYTATSGYVGTGAMITTPNTGVNNDTGYVTSSPRLDYQVNFTKTGTHYVWVRGLWPNGGDNSVHVGLDGAAVGTADRISNETVSTTAYTWTNSTRDGVRASLTITTTGLHTINLWMREDGTIVDRLLLTTNASYTASGSGPAESPRQGGGGASPALLGTRGSAGPTVSRVDPLSPNGVDGVPVQGNGPTIINQWDDHPASVYTRPVTVPADQLFDTHLGVDKNGDVAVLRLEWDTVARGLAWEIVPLAE